MKQCIHRGMPRLPGRAPAALVLAFLLWGCQGATSLVKPPLVNDGAAYLYAQPYPQDAGRLSFEIAAVAAVKEGGGEFPFSLSLKEFSSASMPRERLVGSAELPPGRYDGLAVTVQGATLAGEEGRAALRVPEAPVRIDFPFEVRRGKAVVLSMALRHAESLRGGVFFRPAFDVVFPSMPVLGLAGFATGRGSNTVTMFDKRTGRVAAIIPTGAGPAGVVLDPVRRRVYVALSGDDAIEAIDLLSGGVLDRIRLNAGDRPRELALTPDRNTLVAVDAGSNAVSVIDPLALMETDRIGVGNGPASVLIDPGGKRAFVFNTLSNTISVIDLPTRRVVATIGTDAGPIRGQFNRKGDRLYVIHQWSPYLSVIDPLSFSVVLRQSVGAGADALKVDPKTDLIYLARRPGADVEIFDPLSLVPSDFIPTGVSAAYMTIDDEGNNLVLVLPDAKTCRMVDLFRKGTVAEVDVGDDPYWVAIAGER